MAQENSVGLRVLGILAVLAVLALPEPAICDLAVRALPPYVVCAAEGRLPDPTDCSYYMDCTWQSDGSYTQTIRPCPGGTYYNACEGNCSYTERPDKCSIACDTSGTVTVSSDNPAVYFVCIKNETGIYLNVSMCSNFPWDDKINNCSPSGGDSTCPVNQGPSGTSTCNGTYYYGDEKNCSVFHYCRDAGAPPDTGSCSSDQYFTTYNHSCVEFHCTQSGLSADPANCSRYYVCVEETVYIKEHFDCNSGSHYNSSTGTCQKGSCTTVCPAVAEASRTSPAASSWIHTPVVGTIATKAAYKRRNRYIQTGSTSVASWRLHNGRGS